MIHKQQLGDAREDILMGLCQALGFDVIIPKHKMVMGTWSAALIVRDASPENTQFRGWDLSKREVQTRGISR